MKVRIYGKCLQTWHDEAHIGDRVIHPVIQYELAYKEYDPETGKLVGSGSEDFSPERRKRELSERWAWVWDGISRNRGGHRSFQCIGHVIFRESERADVKNWLSIKYHGEVELRI